MKSKANEELLTALQQVVGATLKCWLNENKAEVLQVLRATIPGNQTPPPTKKPEQRHEPEFLNTAEVAARWQLHPESVRRIVREGRLPRMFIGRRSLVPLSAILDCEKRGSVPSRR